MSPEAITALGGVAAGVITALGVIVRYFLKALKEQRQEIHLLIVNHLSRQTEALNELTQCIDILCERVERWGQPPARGGPT